MIALLAVALGQDLVKYDANNIVAHGTTPSVTFRVQETGTFGFGIDCGVKRWSVAPAAYTIGQSHTLELTGTPLGDHHCTGSIEINMADGRTGTLTFQIPVRSLNPLTWVTQDDGYSAEKRTLRTTASRPLKTAQAALIGADGSTLERVFADLTEPNSPRFQWTTSEEVLKIVVTANDSLGASSTLTLSPWTYRIPHEDVVFDSAHAAITDAESHKLEATWGDIQGVLNKYGSIVEIQLFVAGYTDTVGTTASNLGLSRRRAKSIATWFRGRGFSGEIHYQGFGESALAVPTADEVENPSNRRALYILGAAPPRTSTAIPRSNWKPL